MRRLVIFEGPDGAGKTTLAAATAHALGTSYRHHGPYPGLGEEELVKTYARSMLPAVLGFRDVVLDRCWISETPYGLALRGGADRVGARRAELEALARLCRTTVVLCLPPFGRVLANWRARKGAELVEDETRLKTVYDCYERATALPAPWELTTVSIDPFADGAAEKLINYLKVTG